MKKENVTVLVMPDIHGRTFWKDAIEKFPKNEYPDLQIIFLGDYLDPYTGWEPITSKEAYDNFIDLLEYTKNDPRVTLLIGNHDWHYFVNLDTCRLDFNREESIKDIFINNLNRFSLIKILEFDNIKYMFTHAGITVGWLKSIYNFAKDEIDKWKTNDEFPIKEEDPKYIWLTEVSKLEETQNYEWIFNECLKHYDDTFYSCLPSMVSRERGGWYAYGSLIWADVHEHIYSIELQGYYQIFGHTMTYPTGQKDYVISPNGKSWAMIDASQAFIMDVEGNIEPLTNIE